MPLPSPPLPALRTENKGHNPRGARGRVKKLLALFNMDLKWKHPFTAMSSGPTSCGKSTFVTRFLKHLDALTDTDFCEVVYCAPESSYPDLSECKVPVKFMDCIPDVTMFADKKPRLIILDDLMSEAATDSRVTSIFTRDSHHMGLSTIFITQNIFHKGKGMRDISLNCHFIVVFKSPRDRGQITSLARQICPGNTKYISEIFEDATRIPYGYLVLDLSQKTPDHLRYRTNIFPDDDPPNVVYVPKNFHL